MLQALAVESYAQRAPYYIDKLVKVMAGVFQAAEVIDERFRCVPSPLRRWRMGCFVWLPLYLWIRACVCVRVCVPACRELVFISLAPVYHLCVCASPLPRFTRTPRQITALWQARFDVQELFTDLEIGKSSFPSRRNVIKYDLTQEFGRLKTDAAQLLRDTEHFREIKTLDQVRVLPPSLL